MPNLSNISQNSLMRICLVACSSQYGLSFPPIHLCLQDARNNVAGVFYSGRPHCLKELHAEYIGWQSITKSAIPRIIPRFQDISAESVQSWHKLLLHFAGRMPSQNCLGGYQRQYTREYFHDADYTKEGVKLLEWCVLCWNRKECNSIDNYREGRVVNKFEIGEGTNTIDILRLDVETIRRREK